MALKDVLVYVDQSEHAFARLRLAADLARRHQSRLAALFVREPNPRSAMNRVLQNSGRGPLRRSPKRTGISDNRSIRQLSNCDWRSRR
jgi:hypothetical protein